jgi:hypothetical protein
MIRILAGMSARRTAAWLLAGGVLLLVVFANWHLVDVAVRSQPDCVPHVRPGAGAGAQAQFSAAKSSCTPN